MTGLFANFDYDRNDDWASISPSTLWYAPIYISTYSYVCMHFYVCVYICTYAYVRMHSYVCVCTHAYINGLLTRISVLQVGQGDQELSLQEPRLSP